MQTCNCDMGGAKPDREAMPDLIRMSAAQPFCRRIQLLLAKGHYAAARRALSEAEHEMETDGDGPLLDTTLADAGVCTRTLNILDSHFDASTIGDLLELPTRDLLEVPNSGPKTVDTIWRTVVQYAAGRLSKP